MSAQTWDYGGAYKRIDMNGEIALPNGSRVAVCDWTAELPAFMHEADTLFVDPPWNAGNRNSFYTKAGLPRVSENFGVFLEKLFERLSEIAPRHLFLEMGKEHLARCLIKAGESYKHVTFYNSIYYKRPENKCYVIHATSEFRHRRYKELEDMPQSEIVRWLCNHHEFECIGDLCMGRGLVGRSAYAAGKRFVGTELNPKRLAVLVDWIQQQEKERSCSK
jgi:hypothetical protein